LLAAYRRAHDQGGNVTKQCNLRPFCAWLAAEFDISDPYTDHALNCYARIIEPHRPGRGRAVTDWPARLGIRAPAGK
jgi:hypothetical protein